MFLLDTHTLLWSRLDPAKLNQAHKDILGDTSAQKFISTISIWEISLKFALSKLELGGHTPEEFLSTAKELGFSVVSPESEVYASFYRLKPIIDHKDPFDRLLIWQAINSNLTLLSYDQKLSQYRPQGLRLA
jgi:PIN domain nuclease of toxin-antitoxin system